MRYQDLGGRKLWVFNMADHLCGGFDAKLAGVDVNRGQLRRGKTRKQRIIKRKNGKVSRDRQSGFRADAFQGQGKDIIADNNGGRPAGRPEQCMYRCIFPGGDGGEFYTVFRFWHNAMAGQCQLVAVSAVGRKNETVIYAKVGDFPLPGIPISIIFEFI